MYIFDIRCATVIAVVFDPVIEHLTQNASCFCLFSNVACFKIKTVVVLWKIQTEDGDVFKTSIPQARFFY